MIHIQHLDLNDMVWRVTSTAPMDSASARAVLADRPDSEWRAVGAVTLTPVDIWAPTSVVESH